MKNHPGITPANSMNERLMDLVGSDPAASGKILTLLRAMEGSGELAFDLCRLCMPKK